MAGDVSKWELENNEAWQGMRNIRGFFVGLALLSMAGCPGPGGNWRDDYIYDNCGRCPECCVEVDEGDKEDEN